jgi:hypothetical protein
VFKNIKIDISILMKKCSKEIKYKNEKMGLSLIFPLANSFTSLPDEEWGQ